MAHSCSDTLAEYQLSKSRAGSSGRWLQFGSEGPRELLRGWSVTDIEDLGRGGIETCQMCLREEPRFIHVMERTIWDEEDEALVTNHFDGNTSIRTGCVCAAWMSGRFDRLLESRRLVREELTPEQYEGLRKVIEDSCECAPKQAADKRQVASAKRLQELEEADDLARVTELLNDDRDFERLRQQNELDGNPDDKELVVADDVVEHASDRESLFLEEVKRGSFGKGKRRSNDSTTQVLKRSRLEEIRARREATSSGRLRKAVESEEDEVQLYDT
jgi:hypothetical protein